MASKQAKLVEVNRWQMGRPQWNYHPTLTYWHRFILTAMHDAFQVEGGKPTDEALLARDWFATSSPGIEVNGRREFVSFPECCHWLDLDVDAERVGVLAAIDAHADFDTDEAWSRLEVLSAAIPDDTEALFEVPDVFRVVPVRDQGTLLPASYTNGCAGKDDYPSESSAYVALGMLKRGEIRYRKSDVRWDTMDVYHCLHCEQFHIGHP
jgi:hypothetical protein